MVTDSIGLMVLATIVRGQGYFERTSVDKVLARFRRED